MTIRLCGRTVSSRSRFIPEGGHRCQKPAGHRGRCSEFHYLEHFGRTNKRLRAKIIRDATMTTGAAWKSDDAGPNRIRRWAMLLSDAELLPLGVDMAALRPIIVAKLREKAATYEACMSVAKKLTHSAYQMPGAPVCPPDIRSYLESHFGPFQSGSTTCLICREALPFDLFQNAVRGKAEIETAHRNPRFHSPENVGFAHRGCNIAQGPRTVDEFYDWIRGIIERVESN